VRLTGGRPSDPGVTLLGSDLEAKRLEILRRIAPDATLIGVLINPTLSDSAIRLERTESSCRTPGRLRPTMRKLGLS
jgi:hypothetical protein